MLLITAELGLPNIVDNHFPHFFTAVFVGQEVLGKCCCSDFGDVFVFGDGSTSSSVKSLNAIQSSSVIILA